MTLKPEDLKPCPFCGGPAEVIHLEGGENDGGSCVSCTMCFASSPVEFGFKENFISNWNRRSSPQEREAGEPVAWAIRHPDEPDELEWASEVDPRSPPLAEGDYTAGWTAEPLYSKPPNAQALEARVKVLEDTIDGLESELQSAVEVAFRRGAHEWVRLNYPAQFATLTQGSEGDKP